jgi:dTDP-4-dehydrorhamnose reductase
MKLLITGAKGLLGKELMDTIMKNGKHTAVGYQKDKLDITDRKQIKEIIQQEKPDGMINAAGFTNVDLCEIDKDRAFLINGYGPSYLAAEAKAFGIKFLHVSSDYVFSGEDFPPYDEEDTTNPHTIYGKSKKLGEELALHANKETIIVRTSRLFGHGGKNFVNTIYNLARNRDEIRVANDQFGCPTYTRDLATAMLKLLSEPPGIYHVANSGSCTWYEFAEEILRVAELNTKLIPISTEQYNVSTPRSKYALLSLNKIRSKGIKMRHWREALRDYARTEFQDGDRGSESEKSG